MSAGRLDPPLGVQVRTANRRDVDIHQMVHDRSDGQFGDPYEMAASNGSVVKSTARCRVVRRMVTSGCRGLEVRQSRNQPAGGEGRKHREVKHSKVSEHGHHHAGYAPSRSFRALSRRGPDRPCRYWSARPAGDPLEQRDAEAALQQPDLAATAPWVKCSSSAARVKLPWWAAETNDVQFAD